ncbi:hypothetical protein KFK09_008260 [Dendrobium nobile]|uniref:Uncharacterized protein n=1 Tax=Dendrobium nobile TaxID=94219 RepID=A0A8T3BMM2_DENNO|nr:hypothetical protein KFK09_008260 [Dendrobium nobile]
MPGTVAAAATAMEPVEPQSLKKLSLKSLKRAFDLFSPIHGHYRPSDPASKQIRISYKLNAEYGSVKNLSSNQVQDQVSNDANAHRDKAPTSSALALPGKDDIKDLQKGGSENAIIPGPTMPPKALESGIPSRSISGAVVSISGSFERYPSTSALMERIPSRWPRPTWHPPWKNYRVISGHLGWVRSIAFDPSNSWFCTGSADRTIKSACVPLKVSINISTYGTNPEDGLVLLASSMEELSKMPNPILYQANNGEDDLCSWRYFHSVLSLMLCHVYAL